MNNLLSVLELKAYATTSVGTAAITGISVTSVSQLVTVIANVLVVFGLKTILLNLIAGSDISEAY